MKEWIGREFSNVKIEKYLAEGSMSDVYLGWHKKHIRRVAVKILHARISEDPQFMARFKTDAEALTAMSHSNIVQCLDCDVADGRPYFIMEMLEGSSLKDYMRGLDQLGYLLPLHVIVDLMWAIASAIDYAHEAGFIHLDLQPANIMLESKILAVSPSASLPVPPDLQPIIADFGLASMARALHDESDGVFMVTPAYMSPEQIRGKEPGPRSDIYALGIVLYELLVGQHPFDSEDGDLTSLLDKHLNQPPPKMANVHPKIEAVIRKALEKKPRKRYKSVSAFAKRLAEVASKY